MDEYIKKSEVLNIIDEVVKTWKPNCGISKTEYLRIRVKNIPCADVQKVVACNACVWHVDDGVHNCTKLGMICPDDADFYCKYGKRPNRGADMRGEK